MEIVAGRQRIKPSNKAKWAVGIYSSDEESDGEAENTNVKTGSKCKSGKSNVNSISKKLRKVPKTNQPHKRAHIDSDDAESTDEDEDNAGDQADAYEWLQLEYETDWPVFARINFAYYIAAADKYLQIKRSNSSRGNDSRTANIHTIFTPEVCTLSDNTTEKGHWCEVCK